MDTEEGMGGTCDHVSCSADAYIHCCVYREFLKESDLI